MTRVDIDMSEFAEFFGRVEAAAKGDFRKEFELFLEGVGNEFLRVLQDEIVRRKVIDSRQLLSSFTRGEDGNVWNIEDDGLTLEVGTNVEYAAYVNFDHRTFDPEKTKHFKLPNGEDARFVPGYWDGDRFVHDKEAKGGMVLKFHWVKGKHYWESALRIMDKMFPELLEKKMQDWLDEYFG